jgi:hypothetical protein
VVEIHAHEEALVEADKNLLTIKSDDDDDEE